MLITATCTCLDSTLHCDAAAVIDRHACNTCVCFLLFPVVFFFGDANHWIPVVVPNTDEELDSCSITSNLWKQPRRRTRETQYNNDNNTFHSSLMTSVNNSNVVELFRLRSCPISPKKSNGDDNDESSVVVYTTESQSLRKDCRLIKDSPKQLVIDATDYCRQILAGHPRWCSTLLLLDSNNNNNNDNDDDMQQQEQANGTSANARHDLMLEHHEGIDLLGLSFVRAGVRQALGMLQNKRRRDTTSNRDCVEVLVSMVQRVIQHHWPERQMPLSDALSLEEHAKELHALVETLERQLQQERAAQARLQQWLAHLRHHLEPTRVSDAAPQLPPMDRVRDVFPSLQAIADYSVVFCVQSGSAMYRLNTPSSDQDYRLVYIAPSVDLLSIEGASTKVYEAHTDAPYGSDKHNVVEYSAVELIDYLRTAAKGNPNSVELLFVNETAQSTSWIWQELRERRRRFLTRTCLSQYFGYVARHCHRAKKLKDKQPTLRAFSKAMYHVFHKLFEIERMLGGEDLHVALQGEEREFVYGIRTTEMTPERAEQLIVKAENTLKRLKEESREFQGSELRPDEIEEWCLSVRMRLLQQEGR